ncbi:hypothetical protein GCK32_010317 [Trichostrongylus colubriformis]|uniref:Vps41 beta-propeller domain-containing protein n=1 Tax=Trichostrongylus colubriformis TaxID=6319 RepID=A0AAN8IQ95_TRICO
MFTQRNASSSRQLKNNDSSAEVEMASPACWNRLRTVMLAIRSTRETLRHHHNQVQENGDLYYLTEAHFLANEIRHLEIITSGYHRRVEQLKRACIRKRITLAKTTEELVSKRAQSELKDSLLYLDKVCDSAASVLETRRKYLLVYTELIKARRRLLLNEIYDLFEIEYILQIHNASEGTHKGECACIEFSSIRGAHLPVPRDMIGHQEIEIAAAFGHVLHFLGCASQLLDYIFRYSILSGASTSSIYSPKDSRSLPLHGTRWRSGRVRLDQALVLLERNVSQLREDTGFSSYAENILLAIHEWIGGILKKYVLVVSKEVSSVVSWEVETSVHVVDHIVHDMRVPKSRSLIMASSSEMSSREAVHEENSSLDDDEILLEPRFKYERVEGRDAKQMISSQVLTSIAAHAKLIAVGTQMGYIWIMDHFGHVDNQNVPVMRPHRSAVTRLVIDEPGNYVMSCANDGRVAISGIGCNNLNHVVALSVMPRSIAINPFFSLSTSTPMFAIGERNFVLYEKKFFNYKEMTIFRGGEQDGFITQCTWRESLIAFTCDKGTRIFDRLCLIRYSLLISDYHFD